MRKILSLALVAATGLWLAGCNEKGSAAGSTPLTDSVSELWGEISGNNYAQQLRMDSTIKMEQVVKGFEAALRNDTTNHGYMAGLALGNQLLGMFQDLKQRPGFSVNERKFAESFKKALLADSALSPEVATQKQMALESLFKRAQAEAKANDPVAQKNKADGEEFLKKKAAEAGYQKTPSGVVYKVLTEGKGENFTEADEIEVKYRGMHVNGEVFDATNGDETRVFRMGSVIPGFGEILKLMKPGQKVEVIIPGDLAYGPEGREPAIGSNETLVFELETVGRKAGQ